MRWLALVLVLPLLPGCSPGSSGTPPDQGHGADLASGPDLARAQPDLGVDLAPARDLRAAPDLAARDLSPARDLTLPLDARAPDLIAFDLATPDLATPDLATPDLATAPDLGAPCLPYFGCDARTAAHECGVTTPDGQRYPDRGAPYCSDILSRVNCSCDLIQCTSPLPLCPGTYRAVFRERMISGCDGIPGVLSGTCESLWNVVDTGPGGRVLSDRTLYNVDLDWGFADYEQTFTIAAPTTLRLVVEQDCWFEDVMGVGNAGRSEVAGATVMP